MNKFYFFGLLFLLLGRRSYSQHTVPTPQVEKGTAGAPTRFPIRTSFEAALDTSLSYVRVERLVSPAQARTGEASLLLSGQSGDAYFVSSKLIPIAPTERATVKVYATYTSGRKPLEKLVQSTGVAISAYSQRQPANPQETQNQKPIQKLLPYLGVGIAVAPAFPARLRKQPRAYLRYLLYDADTVLVASGIARVGRGARNNWQELALNTTAPTKGFLQVVFLNEGRQLIRADDFTVQVTEVGIAPTLYTTRPTNKYRGRLAEVLGLTNSFGCLPEECDPNNPDLETSLDLFCQCYPDASDCGGSHPVYPPCNKDAYNPEDCKCGLQGDPHSPPCPTGVNCDINWQPNSNEWCQCHPGACNTNPDPNPNPGTTPPGGGTTITYDCNHTQNGSAHVDACGTCVGGATGKISRTYYQDSDNDSWGNSGIMKVCYSPGPGWVLRGGDHNDNCHDYDNEPDQCMCSNPSVSAAMMRVAPDASDYSQLGTSYGLTSAKGVEFEIGVCRDGNRWKAVLLTLDFKYSVIARLIPGVSEVSNITANNACKQLTDLQNFGMGIDNGTTLVPAEWYMLAAVEAHEENHVDYYRVAFDDVKSIIESNVEKYTIPYSPGQTATNAQMQLEQLVLSAGEDQIALTLITDKYADLDLTYHYHSSAGPVGPPFDGTAYQAESQVIASMIAYIKQLYIASQSTSSPWPFCPGF